MAQVDPNTVWAVGYYWLVIRDNRKTLKATFLEMGVTTKQWDRYNQTKRLKVRPRVKAKMDLIGSMVQPSGDSLRVVDNGNLPTLLKAIDAKYKGVEK